MWYFCVSVGLQLQLKINCFFNATLSTRWVEWSQRKQWNGRLLIKCSVLISCTIKKVVFTEQQFLNAINLIIIMHKRGLSLNWNTSTDNNVGCRNSVTCIQCFRELSPISYLCSTVLKKSLLWNGDTFCFDFEIRINLIVLA